jgi:integrase
MPQRRTFGRIRKLPSGRWQVRYPSPEGTDRTAPETFRTKAEADRYLAGVAADLTRGQWIDDRLGQVIFDRWADRWQTTTGNLRPSSRARDDSYLRSLILPAFGRTPVSRISQLDVRGWVAELTERGLAPATVIKAYQILGKILASAVDGGLIAVTPCRRVPLPKVERQEMRFLTPTEVTSLADAIDPRYRALVLLAAYGGLRLGELAGLRRRRVDLLRGRVDIAEIAVEVSGTLTYGPPKTRAGRRVVSLPRPIVSELAAHLDRYAASDPEAPVFPAPAGGTLRTPAFRRRVFTPAVTSANLTPLRPHDLRHTAVAFWIADGANPKQIAVRAGHSSVSFTLDRYGHLFDDADDDLLAALEARYSAATEPDCSAVTPRGA